MNTELFNHCHDGTSPNIQLYRVPASYSRDAVGEQGNSTPPFRLGLLNDGKITFDEVNKIKAHIERDGQLDYDDIAFLIQLLADAEQVCGAFDAMFFPALRRVLLADGKIGMDEQYQLLRISHVVRRWKSSRI